MKALGVPVLAIVLCAGGLVGLATSAMAQSGTDIPTGSTALAPTVTAMSDDAPAPPAVSMLQLDFFLVACRDPLLASSFRWLSPPQSGMPPVWAAAVPVPQRVLAGRRTVLGARAGLK